MHEAHLSFPILSPVNPDWEKKLFEFFSRTISDNPLPNLLVEVKKHFLQLYIRTVLEQKQTTITSCFCPVANIQKNITLMGNVKDDDTTKLDMLSYEALEFEYVGLDVALLEKPSTSNLSLHPILHLHLKSPSTPIIGD